MMGTLGSCVPSQAHLAVFSLNWQLKELSSLSHSPRPMPCYPIHSLWHPIFTLLIMERSWVSTVLKVGYGYRVTPKVLGRRVYWGGDAVVINNLSLRGMKQQKGGFPCDSDGKESACHAGELGSIPGLGRCPGGGHGNPLQYSCLENPMDRGAWWATVHGVTKSRMRLSD